MKNISFDNPYLLILWIPLVALILLLYFIAIRKESKSRDTRLSLALHLLIVTLAVIAVAGTTYTAVITKTEVVVIADVSYSAKEKLDTTDDRIEELRRSFASNTDMAVVTFGGDCELTTDFGESFSTVKDSKVDTDTTDIAAALNYAAKLFSDNTIKRVVLITDAMSTGMTGDDEVISAVNSLFASDVRVDAIFLDSNLEDGVGEAQVSSVDFKSSAYLGHTTVAEALVMSSVEQRAIVELHRNGKSYAVKTATLVPGFNLIPFDITADAEGEFEYSLRILPELDVAVENNRIDFVQRVSGELRVLLLSSNTSDTERVRELYGENAEIDTYRVAEGRRPAVPYTVEELSKYDEIIISDVNLLDLPNYSEFIKNLDTVVSEFGKSLLTFGNNNIQNKEEDIFKSLENMLPVSYGNNKRDAALVTFIVDCSKSMNTAGRLNTTRELLVGMLDLLNPEDKVCIISFYADNYVEQPPIEVGDKAALIDIIENNLEPKQGTIIGSAIERAYIEMKDLDYDKKMAVLISDGLSFKKESEDDTALTAAASMYANGIVVSTINMWSNTEEATNLMESVAELGGGTAYYIENERDWQGKIKTEFADDLTESVIRVTTDVLVDVPKDSVMSGVSSLPAVSGFVNAKVKDNANTVLSVNWVKNEYATLNIPLYAYWNYGNGRVATLNTQLSGEWTSGWTTESSSRFLTNLIGDATPQERRDYPYTVNVMREGTLTRIELIPAELNIDATANIKLVLPSGEEQEYKMIFDSTKFVLDAITSELGRYDLCVSYAIEGRESYDADITVNISYYDEYDRFVVYDDTVLHDSVKGRGEVVSETELPSYKSDESKLTMYVIDFTLPLLIAAAALFVVDVIIRKLKWKDIKSFFVKVKRG